jgi:hypothetical protein
MNTGVMDRWIVGLLGDDDFRGPDTFAVHQSINPLIHF